MKKWEKICFIISIFAIGSIFYFILNLNNFDTENVAFAQSPSITIITLTNNNALLGGTEYSIIPNPLGSSGIFTIKDNSALDSEKDKDGIIIITGIKNGNYTISQISAPIGYNTDKLSKIIQVKDSSAVSTFTNVLSGMSSVTSNSVKNITYTAKFECGSISADEGPLRPGHYDTDLSIFNKQNYQISILWNAVLNDGPSSNAVLKSLDSETSTSLTCQDIRKLLGNNNENFVEGFVIINVPLDSTLQPEKGTTLQNLSGDEINLLNVQVFYTANALPTLPHEVVVDKISFYIIQDDTGKIPKEMIRKTLDISIPSNLNELSNTETKVKNILAQKYNLTDDDLGMISVRIKDISVGVGVLIDDHAISLITIQPQTSS
ncbi:MAG: prealbumin-like fold domain-containing protein [Thaumarchaeota archaeon]|nr:prealbumin-like fold domain-containing protein [Nitrososphaerota archaeon]MBI3642057.1 prealbumin-like fold domain-containing protein [Nitrososphaerota archaeon]